MPRSLATAALVAAALSVAATEGQAHADGAYFAESFGGAKVSSALESRMNSVFRGRLTLGYRFGDWAVEGFAGIDAGGPANNDTGYVERTTSDGCDCQGSDFHDSVMGVMGEVGVNVKHFTRISEHTEVYLRGGLSKAWLDGDYEGRGIGVGAGLQVKGKVPAIGLLFWPLFFTDWGPKITMAGFVDTGVDFYRLHAGGNSDGDSIDGTMHSLTAGVAFGSDF